MRRVDLHTHSTASDGTDDPAALPSLAKRAGLAAFALTDHDTLAGLPAARAAAEEIGVELVAGIELGAWQRRGEMHVLGYFVAEDHPGVNRTLADLRRGRAERIHRTVERLVAAGAPVAVEDVMRIAGEGSPGRPHVARALVAAGHVGSLQEAFDVYLAEGRPAFVPRRELSPTECVALVRRAGGVSVLAHPVTVAAEVLEKEVEALARYGLAGIEADHPRQDEAFRARVRALAKAHDLVVTGGSDYHGGAKPGVAMGAGDGSVAVDYAAIEELRERL